MTVSAGEILYSLLSNSEDVTDLTVLRIYPNLLPQGCAMPAITYQQISGVRDYVMGGVTGVAEPSYQVTCWAKTYAGATALAKVVRELLNCYQGTVSETVVQLIMLNDEGDIPQFPPETKELVKYGKRLDFTIWFEES